MTPDDLKSAPDYFDRSQCLPLKLDTLLGRTHQKALLKLRRAQFSTRIAGNKLKN